jgi:hypothetical protein
MFLKIVIGDIYYGDVGTFMICILGDHYITVRRKV